MHAEILIIVVCWGQLSQAPAPSNAVSESLDVRYARAQLQLAEANLNRVEQINKQVAGSVPSSVVAEYQHDVQVAKTRLEQAAAGQAAGEFQVWLQRAEAEHNTAETTWKIATTVNGHLPGTFDPLDIERFRFAPRSPNCNLSEVRRWLTPASRPNCNGKSTCWTTRFSV